MLAAPAVLRLHLTLFLASREQQLRSERTLRPLPRAIELWVEQVQKPVPKITDDRGLITTDFSMTPASTAAV